jgi:hypothetical protein
MRRRDFAGRPAIRCRTCFLISFPIRLLPIAHRGPGFSASQASRRDLIDQRWIFVPSAGLVDPPRHSPHAKAILGGWP